MRRRLERHETRVAGRYVRAAWVTGLGLMALLGAPTHALAQASNCYSSNPADWPPPARPYFLFVFDNSGSMVQCTNPATTFPTQCPSTATRNSCGLLPLRINDGKCALRRTVQAFSEADFGLMTFDQSASGCGAACTPYEVDAYSPEHAGSCVVTWANCSGEGASATGGKIRVGLPVSATTVSSLLSWTDDDCSSGNELMPGGPTPLNGSLRDAARYLRSNASSLTPSCRPVNVILITDGEEYCEDSLAVADAATDLFATGLGDGSGRAVRVYPVGFGGLSTDGRAALEAVADNGQCSPSDTACRNRVSALFASNEQELSQRLAAIIGGAVAPEVCDNVDNNCNGCVDEGYKHYCNRNKTAANSPTQPGQCCNWTTQAQRQACVNNYLSSVTSSNPQGDTYRLPCYTPTGSQLSGGLTESDKWVCYNPGEYCDDLDNNCEGTTPNASTADEGVSKCGGHCPVAETCNATDDNCDGIVDNASGSGQPFSLPNCYQCTPSAEICDGCDNDCDGVADDNVAPINCGLPSPSNCAGTRSCQSAQAVAHPGACLPGAPTSRWGNCSNSPQSETCDGQDNDCDGSIDEGISATACNIPGTTGLVYHDQNPLSQCVRGQQPCSGQCAGWVGPTQEICDGIDNDCDGLVDGNDPSLVGVNQPCDAACNQGQTACINGVLMCQSTVQPQPEVCDGQDNDCNGIIDDGILVDAPSSAQKPCWNVPADGCGSVCTYSGSGGTVSWCAPTGASCHGLGSLATPPCRLGELQCQGGGWRCVGSMAPLAEVCDGVDNNCDGSTDNGLALGPCGTDQGECQSGTQVCTGGALQCQNSINPSPEVCDGLDNDCDGVVDNGIAIGTPCSPAYDTNAYPGPRTSGLCRPGISECSSSGAVVCNGGVGPSPEVCDGLDNDCDGQVDEVGVAPNGINGTSNPQNSTQTIGEACGQNQGACKAGAWACVNAQFVCNGAIAPQTEVCDCIDNDCDGQIDEDPSPGSAEPALCSADKVCVTFGSSCQCAAPCGTGEFPCPTGGFTCQQVNYSGRDPVQSAGERCVIDGCQNCDQHTETGPDGRVLCAPAGTLLDGGAEVPVCECKQNHCLNPCSGVSCTAPQVCTDFGPHAGTCVEDNCWNVPCGSGQACNHGTCVNNPCSATSCGADQVCRPKPDFSGFDCVASCAGVSCQPSQVCRDGQCVESGCAQACEGGQVCAGGDAGGCVPSKCGPSTCANGSYCDPLTGACGNEPCEGVLCPSGQHCDQGQCLGGGAGGAGGSAGSGQGGQAGQAGQGANGGSSQGGSGGEAGGSAGSSTSKGNWGLATGGGGCACETGPGSRRDGWAWVVSALSLGLAWVRWRRSPARKGTE